MPKSLSNNQFIPAMIITGFSVMMSQVILLKELVIIFLGNELTFGITLAVWLLGTAIGSGILGRYVKAFKNPVKVFIVILFTMTLLLPLTIIFIRLNSTIWGIQQGEVLSFTPILLIPLTSLLPICLLSGLLYTLGSYIYHLITDEVATAIAKIYLYEAIGSGLASFLVSIILVRFLDTFQLTVIIFTANIFAISLLTYFSLQHKKYKKIILSLIYCIILLLSFRLFPYFDHYSIRKLWNNFDLLATKTTIYGNLAVTKFEDNVSIYQNGNLMFTYPDLLYAEESVHFALLEHPHPGKVLLIGGGMNGSLSQILTHPSISHIDYVELDPMIINLSKRFLPGDAQSVLSDRRIHYWHQDGRLFVKHAKLKYDVVIINLPDPETTLINRFYTLEFYHMIKNILNENGIMSFSVNSSENVIGDDLANFLNCLYKTLDSVFKEIVLIPGDTNHFIACVNKNIITNDPEVLIARLHERNLNTIYLREYYIPFRMSPDRIQYLNDRIKNRTDYDVNQDLKPVGYFHHLIVWTTYFSQKAKYFFILFRRFNYLFIMIVGIAIFVPFVILKKHPIKHVKYGILSTLAIVGFSTMALEVIIILSFQSIHGYVYFQLAIILSSFMIGLAAGSYFSIKMLSKMKNSFSYFKIFQLFMAIYPLIFILIMINSDRMSNNFILLQVIYFIITVIAGFIAGYQYPLASHLYCIIKPQVEKTAGITYASDLVGACLGALLTSALLIPILGLINTCVILALLNFIIFAGLNFIRIDFSQSLQ